MTNALKLCFKASTTFALVKYISCIILKHCFAFFKTVLSFLFLIAHLYIFIKHLLLIFIFYRLLESSCVEKRNIFPQLIGFADMYMHNMEDVI